MSLSVGDEHKQVNVAPAPVLARLEGLHDGVLGRVEVLGGMLVLGGVTAADMPTLATESQMHPGITRCQAFFAAVRRPGRYVPDLVEMITFRCHYQFPFNWIILPMFLISPAFKKGGFCSASPLYPIFMVPLRASPGMFLSTNGRHGRE